MTEDGISELEDRKVEFTQSEKREETENKRTEPQGLVGE